MQKLKRGSWELLIEQKMIEKGVSNDSSSGNNKPSLDGLKGLFNNRRNYPVCRELRPHPTSLGFTKTGYTIAGWDIYERDNLRVVFREVDQERGYWEAAYTSKAGNGKSS